MRYKLCAICLICLLLVPILSGCGQKPTATAPEGQNVKNGVDPSAKEQTAQNNTATKPSSTGTSTDTDSLTWKTAQIWPPNKYTEKDYTGWKTYINKKLGYRIRYPADWIINACDEGCLTKEVIINPPKAESFTSYISILIDNGPMDTIRSGQLNIIPKRVEENIIFNQYNAYQFRIARYPTDRHIFIEHNNVMYCISTVKDNNQKVLQALASFEFID